MSEKTINKRLIVLSNEMSILFTKVSKLQDSLDEINSKVRDMAYRTGNGIPQQKIIEISNSLSKLLSEYDGDYPEIK